MKISVTKLLRKNTNVIRNMNPSVCRGKNDWESDRTNYTVLDEHEPPKQDDILSNIIYLRKSNLIIIFYKYKIRGNL
jgi:hypothetical protein